MEAVFANLHIWLSLIVGLIVLIWALSSIISVARAAQPLLVEQQKASAILTAAYGFDDATARCPLRAARITVDPARIGHTTRCPACGKVTQPEALPVARTT